MSKINIISFGLRSRFATSSNPSQIVTSLISQDLMKSSVENISNEIKGLL